VLGTRASVRRSFPAAEVEPLRAFPRDPTALAPHDLVQRYSPEGAPSPNRTQSAEIHLTCPPAKAAVPRRRPGRLSPPPHRRLGMAPHLRTELVIDALEMRSATTAEPRPVSHTTRMSIYFFSVRASGGSRPTSTPRPARSCTASIARSPIASFATLESSCSTGRHFTTLGPGPRAHASPSIEGFYNPRHWHSATGMLSPAAHEQRHPSARPSIPILPDRKTHSVYRTGSTSVRQALDSTDPRFSLCPEHGPPR